jgi:hypothetical protein
VSEVEPAACSLCTMLGHVQTCMHANHAGARTNVHACKPCWGTHKRACMQTMLGHVEACMHANTPVYYMQTCINTCKRVSCADAYISIYLYIYISIYIYIACSRRTMVRHMCASIRSSALSPCKHHYKHSSYKCSLYKRSRYKHSRYKHNRYKHGRKKHSRQKPPAMGCGPARGPWRAHRAVGPARVLARRVCWPGACAGPARLFSSGPAACAACGA